MAFLTKFFIESSHKKPHILTFFWGFFSLLRSFYGGISGYLISQWGINNLFLFMIMMAIIPIGIPFIIKNNDDNKRYQ